MFANFVPAVFSAEVNLQLERELVFAEDSTREYSGDVSEKGDRVKILGLGKPTISTVLLSARNDDIAAAEDIEDQSIFLDIDQIRTFNYKIGDIDKQFAIKGVEARYQSQTAHELANEIDTFIAKLAQGNDAVKHNSSSVIPLADNTKTDAEGGILAQIDASVQTLWENDVPRNETLTLTLTPRAYMILKKAYVNLDTNNSAMLKNGFVGQYGDVRVKVSNNVATLSNLGATDFCMLRTKRAIAYVHPMTHTEAYRPDLKFVDCLKGFILFGARIVKPKELIVLNWKYA